MENELDYYKFIFRYKITGAPRHYNSFLASSIVENPESALFKNYGYGENGEWVTPYFIEFLNEIEKEYSFHYITNISLFVPSYCGYEEIIQEMEHGNDKPINLGFPELKEIDSNVYDKDDFYYNYNDEVIIFNRVIGNINRLNSFEVLVPINNNQNNEYRLFIFDS
ncbi:MAG: hypothetical protein LBV17_05105 [Treponema sp.]|jgi:hypothetical protein|nr:hypothetical protein [Treponema sp.]